MQIGPLRLLFESRSGSRIWAGKNKMSKSKKRTLILLDTNSSATAAGRFRFTWSGKDSESRRKIGNKTYKKECRAEVGAFDTTSLTLIRWQNPTPWKSHFSPMQRWLFGLFPTCTFLPFVGVMTLTPPTTSEANFYLFTSDCYFCSWGYMTFTQTNPFLLSIPLCPSVWYKAGSLRMIKAWLLKLCGTELPLA